MWTRPNHMGAHPIRKLAPLPNRDVAVDHVFAHLPRQTGYGATRPGRFCREADVDVANTLTRRGHPVDSARGLPCPYGPTATVVAGFDLGFDTWFSGYGVARIAAGLYLAVVVDLTHAIDGLTFPARWVDTNDNGRRQANSPASGTTNLGFERRHPPEWTAFARRQRGRPRRHDTRTVEGREQSGRCEFNGLGFGQGAHLNVNR